jgi:hypothetical protein
MLQREPGFDQLRFRSHQIYFVNDFAKRNGGRDLSIYQLSRTFRCDAGRVKPALENGLNDLEVRGRHFACDDQSEIQILEWIRRYQGVRHFAFDNVFWKISGRDVFRALALKHSTCRTFSHDLATSDFFLYG